MVGKGQCAAQESMWADLPDVQVQKIGDIFLSTGDLDYYALFRAVCGGWCRSIPERFMPAKWIVLEHILSEDDLVDDTAITLLNVKTGRCLGKKIRRVIRRYFYVGSTTGGLLVLGQRVQPYKTRVYNPLTSSIKHLGAEIPAKQLTSVVVTMSPSLMVFTSDLQNHSLWWIHEGTEEGTWSTRFGQATYTAADIFGVLQIMAHYAGDVFVTDRHGSIISTMPRAANEGAQLQRSARTLEMHTTIAGPIPGCQFPDNVFYLEESDGDLLFVVSGPVYSGWPVVYRVDTRNRILEPVRSIGSQALFVGRNRCISIDANKVRTVQAGSIYYADLSEIRSYDNNRLAWEEKPELVHGYGVGSLWNNERPFRLDELLAEYCRIVEYSEPQMVPPYGEYGYTYYDYYDSYPSD